MKSRLAAGVMTVLLLCGVSTLEAQQGRPIQVLDSRSGSGEDGSIAKDIPGVITVTSKPTIRYEYAKGKDAPELKYARPWLEVMVPFKTNTKSGTPWLDDVTVKVDIFTPVLNSKGKWEWGVFSGKFMLEPVANTGGAVPPGFVISEKGDFVYHVVRFYISPATVSRYMIGMGEPPKNFDKIISGLPVRVTIDANGLSVQGVKPAGKEFASFVKAKLKGALKAENTGAIVNLAKRFDANERDFFLLSDVVLPGSESPWAWFDYERQEHVKKSESRR